MSFSLRLIFFSFFIRGFAFKFSIRFPMNESYENKKRRVCKDLTELTALTHSQMQADKCFSDSHDYLVYCSKFTLLHKSAQEQLVFSFSFLLGCFKVFYIISISYFLFFSSQIWYWYTKMLGLCGDRSSDISRQTKHIHAGFMSPDARTQTLLYS